MLIRLSLISGAIVMMASNFSRAMNAHDLVSAAVIIVASLYLIWIAASISLDLT